LLVRAGMKPRVDRRGRDVVSCPRGTSFNSARTSFFIDGLKVNDGFDINTLNPLDIEAMEVYRSAAERPAQFNLIGYECTVVIWLRDTR
jgi:TonB-dependent Receptor Plug Domain